MLPSWLLDPLPGFLVDALVLGQVLVMTLITVDAARGSPKVALIAVHRTSLFDCVPCAENKKKYNINNNNTNNKNNNNK